MTTHGVTFWVQVEPEFERWSNGDVVVRAVKAVRLTQRYPNPVKDGCTVVKLTMRVPTDRLLPLAPDPIDIPAMSGDVAVIVEDES